MCNGRYCLMMTTSGLSSHIRSWGTLLLCAEGPFAVVRKFLPCPWSWWWWGTFWPFLANHVRKRTYPLWGPLLAFAIPNSYPNVVIHGQNHHFGIIVYQVHNHSSYFVRVLKYYHGLVPRYLTVCVTYILAVISPPDSRVRFSVKMNTWLYFDGK